MSSAAGLRLTGGTARGRVLRHPVPEGVRPTAARVREALFSLVGQRLEGRSFLDACAGTGLVGLEAWSRGATVTWVERDPTIGRALLKNLQDLGAPDRVHLGEFGRLLPLLLPKLGVFDYIFLDPPYDQSLDLAVAAGACARQLVVERRTGAEGPPAPPCFEAEAPRRYGEATLWVYQRRGPTA